MKRFAFTLAELLIALTIVGVIAVLTVPSVTRNIYSKSNIVKLQATIKVLNDAVKNMMIDERVNDIADSSLALDQATFLTKYLKITKQCDEVPDECFASEYTYINGGNADPFDKTRDGDDAMLPSGAVIQCLSDASGFIIDVNGLEAPNVIGRDVFYVDVYDDGTVGSRSYTYDDNDDVTGSCTHASTDLSDFYGSVCVHILESSGWVMDY